MSLHRHTALSLAVVLTLLGVTCRGAFSGEPAKRPTDNTVVRGNVTALIERAEAAARSPCSDKLCRNFFSPVSLTLHGSKTGRVSLVINAVDADSWDRVDDSTAPLLLRGTFRTAAAARAGATRAFSAVVYRDTAIPILEIEIPSTATMRHALTRPALVRAALQPHGEAREFLSARADLASSFSKSSSVCPLNEAVHTLRPESRQLQPSAAPLYDILYLATDFDPNFARSTKCQSAKNCNNKIRGIVHRASLLYEEPFGLVLKVAQQFGPTSFGRSTEPSTILSRFVDYNNANRANVIHDDRVYAPRQADLLQLFTGKALNDEVYGLTYLGVACRNEQSNVASLIVQHVSDSLDPTIVAHHIGHTLNAGHSSEGIMKADLSEPAAITFNEQSKSEISGHLSTYYYECRGGRAAGSLTPTPTPTPTATPTVTPTPDPYPGVPRSLQLSVTLPTPNRIEFRITASQLEPGCSLAVRAAGVRHMTDVGLIVFEIPPTELVTVVRRRFRLGVAPDQNNTPRIYFRGEHVCPNGQPIEVSEVEALNPNIVSDGKKLVSKIRWIRLLSEAFKQSGR